MTLPNYYYILGLDFNASDLDVKTAYRKLSKKFHPDLNDGDKFFELRFKEIQTAYETLIDPAKKAEYLKAFKNQATEEKKSDTDYQSSQNDYANQASKPKTNSTQQTVIRKKRNYSWLYITLPVLIILGFLKGTIQKSIREKAINDAVNSYQPSTVTSFSSDTTINSSPQTKTPVETIKIDTVPSLAPTSEKLIVPDNSQETKNVTKDVSLDDNDNNKASKSETENWILEKLNSYTKEYKKVTGSQDYTLQHHEIFSGYNFSFDNGYLLVTYSKKSFDFISTSGSYNQKNAILKAKIPIYDFDKINDYGYSSDISISIENENQTITKMEGSNQSVVYSFPLSFRSNGETNLVERIQSAFKHLKKFYSKPKSNETF